ncbi:MAG: hypothetical protein WCP53_09385 [Verrucomicrobiota bacterium]
MTERVARLSNAATATILSGASVSDAIDCREFSITGLVIPAAWTAAAITFLASTSPSGTFGSVYDDAGTEVTVASAAVVAGRVVVNKSVLQQLSGIRWLKIRSGVVALAVNQAADRLITVLMQS